MSYSARDWNKMNMAYSMSTQKRLDIYYGRRSLADRIRNKVSRVQFQFLFTMPRECLDGGSG